MDGSGPSGYKEFLEEGSGVSLVNRVLICLTARSWWNKAAIFSCN